MKANRKKYPAYKRKQWVNEVDDEFKWYDYFLFPIAVFLLIIVIPIHWLVNLFKIKSKQ